MKVKLKDGITLKQFLLATFGSLRHLQRFRRKDLILPLKASLTNQGGLRVWIVNALGYEFTALYNSKDKEI